MACSHYEGNRLRRCAAVRGLIIPSVHERERYCLSDDPGRCPTFVARAQRQDPLPEEVYYAIWLPRMEEEVEAPLPAPRDDVSHRPDVPEPHAPEVGVCQPFTAR